MLSNGIEVEADVVQVGDATWALHGRSAYGGEVLLAEFEAPESARCVLGELPPVVNGGS